MYSFMPVPMSTKLPNEALEYTKSVAGKTIYVYLVRLGHLFEDIQPNRESKGLTDIQTNNL